MSSFFDLPFAETEGQREIEHGMLVLMADRRVCMLTATQHLSSMIGVPGGEGTRIGVLRGAL